MNQHKDLAARLAEDMAQAQQLVDTLSPHFDGVPHALVLVALLKLLRTTSLAHPCCGAAAAQACMQLGLELTLRAHQLPPEGAAIH